MVKDRVPKGLEVGENAFENTKEKNVMRVKSTRFGNPAVTEILSYTWNHIKILQPTISLHMGYMVLVGLVA